MCVCVSVCVCVDLEATRSRLLDSEREKSELSLLAQQRLEEIENLKRYVSVCLSVCINSVCLCGQGGLFFLDLIILLKAP